MGLPDIAAVADALHGHPQEFFFEGGRLRQKNSTVRSIIYPRGLIAAETETVGDYCLLSRPDASRLLMAFEEWQRDYWVAARVNSIFARQLRRAGVWRRLWHCIKRSLPERQGESALAIYAQAFARDGLAGDGSDRKPPSRHRPPPHRPKTRGGALELHRVSNWRA
jgi:hypothetical protein